ncbi:FAD-dependent oxidoreductase [Isoptericola jiangsuensis]|uniref:FAD-dependent oxidoreductase n=1 Tax=Isoptericola jiangsuensis TaxID=548579 RepID=UPI003AAD0384
MDERTDRTVERHCDVAVIGGSAAGLAAALQLGRQRRTVVVVDDGTPRNAPAAHMHGYLGHEAAPPSELVAVGREEVRGYGGEVLDGRVDAVERRDDGTFVVHLTGGHRIVARAVLAATGIADELPPVPGLAERWGGQVIHCPFCHGYEVRDQAVVQIVTHPAGLHPTALLRHLTDRLTVVLHDARGVEESAVAPLVAAGVPVLRSRVVRVVDGAGGSAVGVQLDTGEVLAADAVVAGPRFRARAEVFAGAGLSPTAHASGLGDVVEVDPTGRTAVPMLFAAGNITDPGQQVLPAAAHGSRVGAVIAFALADEDLRGARRSGARTDWEQRYDADPVWSANPNGTLMAQVGDLAPGRALDVGAGEGADALWLAEQGWTVTATDISGNALARVTAEAERRGLPVRCARTDASDPAAFGGETYDLVSLQYGSFHRTPDSRGVRNLLDAVAPGGTLLVVAHDQTPLDEPVDVATQSRPFDPGAYVGVDEIVVALAGDEDWQVDVHETRPRPAGAVSAHHVHDVVLRATRSAG